jgi:Fic family protein
VARLLTGAMLSEHGYTVGHYVSLEQAIAESADAYYQALLDSTHGWHEGTGDPWPWLGYFTSVIARAYAVFADHAAAAQTPGTKQQRVREHILSHAPATFRLADIRTALPGVSDQTIRLVLEQLRGEGKVRADGTGRSATWTRTPDTAHPISTLRRYRAGGPDQPPWLIRATVIAGPGTPGGAADQGRADDWGWPNQCRLA